MREVKPTQKPVPSSDIKDLFFNSGLLDIWATSLEHKYIDRFGNCHLTAAGMEWLFKELVETFKVDMNTAIVAAGYITIDSFQQGADLPNNELTQRNHILRDETTGEYYRWDGDLPKQVLAGSTPESTGGIGKGAWVSVGDASLRSSLGVITKTYTTVESMLASFQSRAASHVAGDSVAWDGYYAVIDGAGNFGVVKSGVHTADGGSIFSISDNLYIEASEDNLIDPRRWGVKANNVDDDWQAWSGLMKWYRKKTVSHVESGMTPSVSALKIKGVAGRSLLSKPLELYGYIHADFSATSFARHQNWTGTSSDYLITSKDIYLADFGGLSFYNTDRALNIQNDNLDNGLIEVKGVYFSKCNNAMRVNCQSSNVLVSNYRFDNCARMLDVVRGDNVVFQGGNMWQGVLTTQYARSINVNNARLILRDVIGVPARHTGSEVAWVSLENGGRVTFDNFRAGAENGGCTLVNNWSKFRVPTDNDPTPVGIRIVNSQPYSTDSQSGAQKSCIIRLFEIPNYINITGNDGFTMTDEIVTFGKSVVSPRQKVSELIDRLSNYSYSIENNCKDRPISDFHPSLLPLFSPSDNVPVLLLPSGTSGIANGDTRFRTGSASVYQLVITGQTESSLYESAWVGLITVGTRQRSGQVYRTLAVSKLASSKSGVSNDKEFTVQARFWSGASQVEEALAGDDNYRLRIQVSGFNAGNEGAGANCYLIKLL